MFNCIRAKFKDLVIEPTICLVLPQPWFIFVSPLHNKLAKRIKAGLDIIKRNGSFDRKFESYYGNGIRKANLASRKLFEIENQLLSPHEIYKKKDLWLKFKN